MAPLPDVNDDRMGPRARRQSAQPSTCSVRRRWSDARARRRARSSSSAPSPHAPAGLARQRPLRRVQSRRRGDHPVTSPRMPARWGSASTACTRVFIAHADERDRSTDAARAEASRTPLRRCEPSSRGHGGRPRLRPGSFVHGVSSTSTAGCTWHERRRWETAPQRPAGRAGRHGRPHVPVFEDRDGAITEFTYARVRRRRSDAAPRGLHALGVGRGDFVVVHLRNCPEFLIAWFALARLGAVMAPSNVANTAGELEHILDVTEARLVDHRAGAAATSSTDGDRARRARRADVVARRARRRVADRRSTQLPRARAEPPDVAGFVERPRRADLHLGHDPEAQGGDAHPRQLPAGRA